MSSIFNYMDQMNDLLFFSLFAVFWLGTLIVYSMVLKKWGRGETNQSDRK
jgi:hypothetical protein